MGSQIMSFRPEQGLLAEETIDSFIARCISKGIPGFLGSSKLLLSPVLFEVVLPRDLFFCFNCPGLPRYLLHARAQRPLLGLETTSVFG